MRGGKRGGDLFGDIDGAFERKFSVAYDRVFQSFAFGIFENDINRAVLVRTEIGDVQNIRMRNVRNGARFGRKNDLTMFSSTASAGERILTVTGLSIKRCVP